MLEKRRVLSPTDLAGHILLGEAHNQAVLVGVVLVLVLAHEAETSAVIGLTGAAAPVLDLEPAEVGRALQNVRTNMGRETVDSEAGMQACKGDAAGRAARCHRGGLWWHGRAQK